MSRFEQDLKKIVCKYYSLAIRDQNELEKFWTEHQAEFEALNNELPPLDETYVYSPAEQRELHWLRCTQYNMSGPPKEANQTMQLEQVRTDRRIKPSEFVSALDVDKTVVMPPSLNIAGVRNAASLKGMKITTKNTAKGWLITRLR